MSSRRSLRSLTGRLVASHLLVALLGGLATALVVRLLAPAHFDRMMQEAGGRGMGPMSRGTLRDEVAQAVDAALVVGMLTGVVVATAAGLLAAYRLLRPLRQVRAATRELAAGRYDTSVPLPREPELAELAADVNRLGQTLAETEARRVRLLGEIAHELRTPLAVIDGYVEGMTDGVLGTGPEELGRIGDEVRRMRRLADDLSALSRADEGSLGLRPTRVDLRSVVSAAAERLRPQAADSSLDLQVEETPEPVWVMADPDRIAQVVTNLVGNAIHATPPGGTVTVGCRRVGAEAEVTVTDTGTGLATEDLDRIFERFFRVQPGGEAAQGRAGPRGSGIGLTISRSLVRAHGGELTAASPGRGHGATLTVLLPLA